MTSLKDFPEINDEGDLTSYERDVRQWKHDFEVTIQERIRYHKKMVNFWEKEVTEKHPLYKDRESIAGEWRVALSQLVLIVDGSYDEVATSNSKKTGSE